MERQVYIWQQGENVRVLKDIYSNIWKHKRPWYYSKFESVKGFVFKYKTIGAELLANVGDISESRRLLFLAIQDDPRSFTAHEYLAQTYEISGDFQSAIRWRKEVSDLDPNDTNNWLKLGQDFANVGNYEEINNLIFRVSPLKEKSTIANDLRALLPSVPTS